MPSRGRRGQGGPTRGELGGVGAPEEQHLLRVVGHVVAVDLHVAQPGCCGAEVRGQVVLEAPQLLHVGEVRDARQRELEDQGGANHGPDRLKSK